MAKKNKKWRRFLAFLRKYAVAVRNIAIFIVIIIVICWCRSQIRRDANTCALNASVAKLTRGPQYYREVVKDLETLERKLLAQKKSDALLLEVRSQLSQCCAMIAADPELCAPEGALHWYRRAWEYDASNESISPAMRTHFEKQTVAVDLVKIAESMDKGSELTSEKQEAAEKHETANDAVVVESDPSLPQVPQEATAPETNAQKTVATETHAPAVSTESADAPASAETEATPETVAETPAEVVAPQ